VVGIRVSRILFLKPSILVLGFYHLSLLTACAVALAVYPLARASNPQTPVCLTLHRKGCTASAVTSRTGELLPHLFTLTLTVKTVKAVLFCCRAVPYGTFLLGSLLLYGVRTFLPCALCTRAIKPLSLPPYYIIFSPI